MERITEVREKIERLSLELSDICNGFEGTVQKSKEECKKKYTSLFVELQDFLKKISEKKILVPVFSKFGGIISASGAMLCVFSKQAEYEQFDLLLAEDAISRARATFMNETGALLKGMQGHLSEREAAERISRLSYAYNTLVFALRSADAILKEAWAAEYERLNKLKLSAGELEAEISALESEYEALKEEAQNRKRALFFSNETKGKNEFTDSISLPIGYIDDDEARVLSWNLSSENILRIKVPSELEGSEGLTRLIENTVLHFINSYPGGATRLLFCDLAAEIPFGRIPSQIIGDSEKLPEKLIYGFGESREIFLTDFDLTAKISADLVDSRRKIYSNIFEFNAKNPSTFSSPLLVVVNGYRDTLVLPEKIMDAIKNGSEMGVCFFIIEYGAKREKAYTGADKDSFDYLYDSTLELFALDNGEGDLMLSYDGTTYTALHTARDFDFNAFSEALSKRAEKGGEAIPLEDVITAHERDNTDFSKELKIPFGRSDNAALKQIVLSSKDSSAHCVIAGATGTGKSSLLQAIVLAGAYHYSPEELEFYLIDMKDGATFYKENGYDYSKLAHVKMMASSCKVSDLRDFISYIMETRTHLDGADDIITYNKGRTGADRQKRSVIIIDEYTMIDDQRCIDALEIIAKQGRSFGVSLILSAQNTASEFSKVITNISNSVEFNNVRIGALLERDSKCRVSMSDMLFLGEQKGNCVGKFGSRLSRFRAAFTPKQNELIQLINERHKGAEFPKTLVIGKEKRLYKDLAECISAPDVTDGALGCYKARLGVDLFGRGVGYTFNDTTNGILLLGDEKRAESIEYSFVKGFEGYYKENRASSLCFLNFGDRAMDARAFTEKGGITYSVSESDILSSVRGIYSSYLSRKSALEAARGTDGAEKVFDPIIVIMHSATEYKRILAKGIALERDYNAKKAARDVEKQPSALSEARAVKMPECNIPADLTLDDIMAAKKKSADTLSMLDRASAYSEEIVNTDPVKMIATLIADGARYGVYFVIQLETREIKSDASSLFGVSLSNLMSEILIIPEVTAKGEASRARAMLKRAAQIVRQDSLSAAIDKGGEMSPDELYRCYYINGDGYIQIIPYEWR